MHMTAASALSRLLPRSSSRYVGLMLFRCKAFPFALNPRFPVGLPPRRLPVILLRVSAGVSELPMSG